MHATLEEGRDIVYWFIMVTVGIEQYCAQETGRKSRLFSLKAPKDQVKSRRANTGFIY